MEYSSFKEQWELFLILINLQVSSAKCIVNELLERNYSISASWNKYYFVSHSLRFQVEIMLY